MMYLLSDVINSAGLALDIIGVILLFFFGLPSRVREGPPVLSFGEDPDSTKQREKQWKRYQRDASPWSFWFLVSPFRLSVTTWVYWAGWSKCSTRSCKSVRIIAGPSKLIPAGRLGKGPQRRC